MRKSPANRIRHKQSEMYGAMETSQILELMRELLDELESRFLVLEADKEDRRTFSEMWNDAELLKEALKFRD